MVFLFVSTRQGYTSVNFGLPVKRLCKAVTEASSQVPILGILRYYVTSCTLE